MLSSQKWQPKLIIKCWLSCVVVNIIVVVVVTIIVVVVVVVIKVVVVVVIVIVILTAGHLFCEEDDHLGEVDGSGGLGDHALGFAVGDGAADGGEGGLQVAGGQETVLENRHNYEERA